MNNDSNQSGNNEKENSIFKKSDKDQKISTLISEVNALKINSAKKRLEEKIKASIEIANLYEENFKLSATVEALSRSLNKRLCQNVTLKEENERHKNEKERLYFLLKYRITQNDYLSKNTSSEIMTIVDRTKSLEKENIDLINKYEDVLNVLESERKNCVQLLRFMFLKTFLLKYSDNFRNDNIDENINNINCKVGKECLSQNYFRSSHDVSILCKLENTEDKLFSPVNFNLNRKKLQSDLEIISHRTHLSNLEDLIIVLIRLYKEKFLKEFKEKTDSTVHFQPQLQLKRIDKTLETNFHSLSLNPRCKSDISSRKKKCVTLSNCHIIRIVHSNQEIQRKITFPPKNIEYRNKNVNLGINEDFTNFENREKWKEISKNFIVTLNKRRSEIQDENYFEFRSLGIDRKFHNIFNIDETVKGNFKLLYNGISNSSLDNEEKIVDSEDSCIEDSLVIAEVREDSIFDKIDFFDVKDVSYISESAFNLALRFTVRSHLNNFEEERENNLNLSEQVLKMKEPVLNRQESVLNLQEPVLNLQERALNLDEPVLNLQKQVSNLVEPVLNLQEHVSNQQESVSNSQEDILNLQKALNAEEKSIKVNEFEHVVNNSETEVSNSIGGRKEKWMMNKSLSRIPVPLWNASKGLKKTREKSKIQATQKTDFKKKEEFDQLSNINCRKEKPVRSLSADRTVFSSSCQELKGISAIKSKINERRSKIPVRRQTIENMNFHIEKKNFNFNDEANRITNTNLNPKAVVDFKLENFNAELAKKVNSKLEKSDLESDGNDNLTIKDSKLDSLIEKDELKPREKMTEIKDVDFKNLADSFVEKRLDEEMRDQLSETLLLKRTKDSTSTTQTLKRFNKTIKETDPTTNTVFIPKISQESIPKIQLENQGNAEEQESQTSTIRRSFNEENLNSISKIIKKSEQLSGSEYSNSAKMANLNIQTIKTVINLLLKSEINQKKKLIIVEGKKKLMKICEKKRKNGKMTMKDLKIIPTFWRKEMKNENTSESVFISKESQTQKAINKNDTILRENFQEEDSRLEKKSPLNSIFLKSQENFETFEMLSENTSCLFNSWNTNTASSISQESSRLRQSNAGGGKEEKQLSNKARTKNGKNEINRVENCVGNSSIVNSVRNEEFIRGIQQSSESSERVSDCKAHLEDFDSRKFTQMSKDSGIFFEKWTSEIKRMEAWNNRVKCYLSQIRMKLLLAEEKAEEESSLRMFERNYSLGDRKELTLRNTVEYEDSKRKNICVNVDLEKICHDMKRVTNIINKYTSARYLKSHSFVLN